MTFQQWGIRNRDPARLKDAIAHFEAAREERTRERVPLQWASTESNLGLALLALDDYEPSQALLERALAAFRSALSEEAYERDPLAWAHTEEHLALTLYVLAGRGGGKSVLSEAQTAAASAREVYLSA